MLPNRLRVSWVLQALFVMACGGGGTTTGSGGQTTATGQPSTTGTGSPTSATSTGVTSPATATGSTTTGGGSYYHPPAGASWQWQLTGTIDLSYSVDIFDIDLFDADNATVAAIHAKGAKAVCYMETGAWENYRPDQGSYPSSVLGGAVSGYPDERYVDIRQLAILRPILDARLDMCKSKGFDGVEPDIDDSFVDVGATAIGFPVTYADQLAFNKAIADDAHARGLAIALKNGVFGAMGSSGQFVNDMEPMVDFAVEESCAINGVCPVLQPFTAHGKAVLHTEYLDEYGATMANYQMVLDMFCPATKPLGLSSILKTSSATLDGWRKACP
jgi:hypothetical protein